MLSQAFPGLNLPHAPFSAAQPAARACEARTNRLTDEASAALLGWDELCAPLSSTQPQTVRANGMINEWYLPMAPWTEIGKENLSRVFHKYTSLAEAGINQ